VAINKDASTASHEETEHSSRHFEPTLSGSASIHSFFSDVLQLHKFATDHNVISNRRGHSQSSTLHFLFAIVRYKFKYIIMSDSPAAKAPFAKKAPLLLQSETGIMRRGSAVDSLDTSNHHNIVSTENSVVSSSTSERDPNGKKLSSGGSTVTSSSTSSSGMSHSANERKELTHTQDDKARTPIVLQMNAPPHPVAEFLFQLTKMLTDDNKEYIEWRKASIFVTDPPVSACLPRSTSYFCRSDFSNINLSSFMIF